MLALLRRRLGLTPGEKDALLEDLLRESEQFILGYTGRRTLPAALEGAVIETAATRFNLLGLEGDVYKRQGQGAENQFGRCGGPAGPPK